MPFVIRYPKEIPAGTRNKDMILNVDFASLLADYAGVKTPKESQGHSFRDNLKGNTPKGGSGGKGAVTKEQILAVSNPIERQRLIAENIALFQ